MNGNQQLESVLADLIKQMGAAAHQYGPEAIGLAGKYLQTSARLSLIFSGIETVVFLVLVVFSALAARFCCLKAAENDLGSGWDPAMIVSGFFTIVFVASTFISASGLLDPDTWIAASNPTMALVQHAMQMTSSH